MFFGFSYIVLGFSYIILGFSYIILSASYIFLGVSYIFLGLSYLLLATGRQMPNCPGDGLGGLSDGIVSDIQPFYALGS